MRRILHILTRPDDSLAREMIAEQRSDADNRVETYDLTRSPADYEKLLDEIVAAACIQSW